MVIPEPEFEMDNEDHMMRSLRASLFNFMKLVTPNEGLVADMDEDPIPFLEGMDVHMERSFVHDGGDPSPTFMVNGVPDAVGHTKARLVWAQTPEGLQLAWKV